MLSFSLSCQDSERSAFGWLPVVAPHYTSSGSEMLVGTVAPNTLGSEPNEKFYSGICLVAESGC